jgi:hypothetical protein
MSEEQGTIRAETTVLDGDEPAVLYQWSARKLRPIILVYVAIVFVSMMAVSYFLLHSTTAVKALAIAAIGFIVPMFPAVANRAQYRFTETGLETRPVNRKAKQDFKEVFLWDELSHVVPIKRGFKYYKSVNESSPIRRLWKSHFSDTCSGEFHVESENHAEVLSILADQNIPTSRP